MYDEQEASLAGLWTKPRMHLAVVTPATRVVEETTTIRQIDDGDLCLVAGYC